MGNCEESLAVGASDCGCGFDENSQCDVLSAQWYNFSLSNTSVESRQWMGSLPRALKFSMANLNFLVVHGSVSRINQFVFPSTPDEEIASQLALAKQDANVDVIISGHSGIPFGRSFSDGTWLNAGVIGMPANDGTDTGWYMRLRLEAEGVNVSWHRLHYDVETTSQSMLKGGLDNGYRTALKSGLWPSTDVLPDEDKRRTGQAIDLDPITLEVETL
jgi:predicted phosphodiesterase